MGDRLREARKHAGYNNRRLAKVRIEPDAVYLHPESTNPRHKPLKLDRMTRAFALVVGVYRPVDV